MQNARPDGFTIGVPNHRAEFAHVPLLSAPKLAGKFVNHCGAGVGRGAGPWQSDGVTGERLTRGELGWLLAQEARGAASALRAEVKELRNSLRPPPPPSVGGPVRITGIDHMANAGQEDRISSLPGERHLNTLDEAIDLLASLQQQTNPRPKRRGRIDLAALLYELAPNCKLSLEPGAGTEVIGDEHELRRMFHLLLNQSGGGEGATLNTIDLRRQDRWIHISVELGPDTAATSDLERRWLSRMAVKHGGRLELHGRRQLVLLPAEASNHEEVDQLKRELQQAQLLGEAYAKELATALAVDVPGPESVPMSVATVTGHWSDPVRALASAILPALQTAVRTTPNSPAIEALDVWARQLALVAEDDDSTTRLGNVLMAVSQVLTGAAGAASKRNVTLRDVTRRTDSLALITAPTTSLQPVLTLLVEHAIAASPAGGLVTIAVRAEQSALVFEVTDEGAFVPAAKAAGLIYGSIDPRSLGRPAGASLLLAAMLAERVGAKVQVSSETEHTQVELVFD